MNTAKEVNSGNFSDGSASLYPVSNANPLAQVLPPRGA